MLIYLHYFMADHNGQSRIVSPLPVPRLELHQRSRELHPPNWSGRTAM